MTIVSSDSTFPATAYNKRTTDFCRPFLEHRNGSCRKMRYEILRRPFRCLGLYIKSLLKHLPQKLNRVEWDSSCNSFQRTVHPFIQPLRPEIKQDVTCIDIFFDLSGLWRYLPTPKASRGNTRRYCKRTIFYSQYRSSFQGSALLLYPFCSQKPGLSALINSIDLIHFAPFHP